VSYLTCRLQSTRVIDVHIGIGVGLNRRPTEEDLQANVKTSLYQVVDLSVDSAAAATGLGWALPGHGLVSAGWRSRLWCQIPVPGTQTETDTTTEDVKVGRGKLMFCCTRARMTGHYLVNH